MAVGFSAGLLQWLRTQRGALKANKEEAAAMYADLQA